MRGGQFMRLDEKSGLAAHFAYDSGMSIPSTANLRSHMARREWYWRSRVNRTVLLRYCGWLVLIGGAACFFATGAMGINFGREWDEPVQIALINNTIKTGMFLPIRTLPHSAFLNYGSFMYDIEVLASLPTILRNMASGAPVNAHHFLISVRLVDLAITGIGGWFVFLTTRRRATAAASGCAAAIYFLSWQLAYHARYIAPDSLLASSAAFGMYAYASAYDAQRLSLRGYLPAISAAIATGILWDGLIVTLPIGLIILVYWRRHMLRGWKVVKFSAASLGIFVLLTILITPGIAILPRNLYTDIQFQSFQYHSTNQWGFHGAYPYIILGRLHYLADLLRYVFLDLPSTYPVVSILVSLLAAAGVLRMLRRSFMFSTGLLLPFLCYFLYLGTVTAFLVRNFLLFLPPLAVFAGFGIHAVVTLLSEWNGPRALRYAAVGLLAMALGAAGVSNAIWLRRSAVSIENTSVKSTVSSLAGWMRSQPTTTFALSAQVREEFSLARVAIPTDGLVGRANSTTVDDVFLYSQIDPGPLSVKKWPGHCGNTFVTFGPQQTDFNCYPSWSYRQGNAIEVLVVTSRQLRAMGLTPRELHLKS